MKTQTRFLALLLALVLIVAGLPAAFAAASPAKPTGLQITTDGKQKTLRLRWNAQSAADGYQICRSTTGKKGSYQKIATVRGKNGYTDRSLQAAKTYYYAVRAFQTGSGGTRYSAYAKTNGSTRLTKSAVQKKLVKANRFYIGWMVHCMEAWECVDDTDEKPVPDSDWDWLRYVRVKSNKYRCVADLKKEAAKYFTKTFYTDFIDSQYADIDGKLYMKNHDTGGDAGQGKGKLKILSLTDTVCKFRVTELDDDYPPYNTDYSLIYQKGKWLFEDMTDSFSIYFQGNDFWIP